jgi:hypothetical protein
LNGDPEILIVKPNEAQNPRMSQRVNINGGTENGSNSWIALWTWHYHIACSHSCGEREPIPCNLSINDFMKG